MSIRSLERTGRRESLERGISRVALAYGFTSAPVQISRRAVTDQPADDQLTASQLALLAAQATAKTPKQVWGSSRKNNNSTISFTVLAARHGVAQALVVKTAHAVAELAGFTDLIVSVSSVGDAESRRRFVRELGSYFKKHAESLSPEIRAESVKNPEGAYRALLNEQGADAARLPRPIDYLSENSRRTMTETLSLFEAVGINYQLEPHLPYTPGIQSELVFAITGIGKDGERTMLASGGRFDEFMKKKEKNPVGHTVGMSITLPTEVELEEPDIPLSCFVIHVGEGAKMKAFSLLDALWKAHIAVSQALLAENLRDQMLSAKTSNATYMAIIGQREALDGTVLFRNAETQMQDSIPVAKLISTLSRKV